MRKSCSQVPSTFCRLHPNKEGATRAPPSHLNDGELTLGSCKAKVSDLTCLNNRHAQLQDAEFEEVDEFELEEIEIDNVLDQSFDKEDYNE